MKKNYVRGFGLLMLLSGASNLLAYNFTITNAVDKTVHVELKTSLVGRGHKDSIVLNPGETGTIAFTGIQAGACLQSYKINKQYGTDFSKVGLEGAAFPLLFLSPIGGPFVGIGIAHAIYVCRSQHLYVIPKGKGKGEGYSLVDPPDFKEYKKRLKKEQKKKKKAKEIEQRIKEHQEKTA